MPKKTWEWFFVRFCLSHPYFYVLTDQCTNFSALNSLRSGPWTSCRRKGKRELNVFVPRGDLSAVVYGKKVGHIVGGRAMVLDISHCVLAMRLCKPRKFPTKNMVIYGHDFAIRLHFQGSFYIVPVLRNGVLFIAFCCYPPVFWLSFDGTHNKSNL